MRFWNKLPPDVRLATSVDNFKVKLEAFKLNNIHGNRPGNFWELSEEIFNRIDNSGRGSYVKFMSDNPHIANYKKINIR